MADRPEYVAVVGFDHDPTKTRVEAGKPVPECVPRGVVKALVKDGVVAPVNDQIESKAQVEHG